MGFKKQFSSKDHEGEAGGAGASNLGKKLPNDNLYEVRNRSRAGYSSRRNMDNVRLENAGGEKSKIFRKSMTEREVRMELFMLEGSEGFEKKSIRTKMTIVAELGSNDFKDWYYEKGVNNDLPTKWEDFVSITIDFCTGQSIENIRKYGEERWSEFLKRIREFIILHKMDEREAFKRIRKEDAPSKFQMIFYAHGITLDEAIDRISEMEEFRFSRKLKHNVKKKLA